MTITTKKKKAEPVHPATPDSENKTLSKAQFIEKRRLETERRLKVKAYEEELKKEEGKTVAPKLAEKPIKPIK